jgi:hypothetical protein
MRSITVEHLNQLLSRAAIQVAAPALGIGRELAYSGGPRRTLVMHFAEAEPLEYVQSVISRILDLSEEWVLLPRYGAVSDLGLMRADPDMAAISFASTERRDLVAFLCSRPTDMGSGATDIYVLASSGETLITWDHHTAAEGLEVQLKSVGDATRLLASLNELGAELELFYLSNREYR